jgi:probable blue pigment (indigoidine) exporter
MEDISRGNGLTLLFAALAPITWGSGYYVAATYLPPDRPLFSAAIRALPFGLLLLATRPRLPRGIWWWRIAVLGTVNISAFFALIFVAAHRLPGGLAATLTATSPIAVVLFAWWLVAERPRPATLAGAVVGAAGVALLVLRSGFTVDGYGIAASLSAVLLFALGNVLIKRWPPPVDLLTLTSWQLVAGGLALVPVALIVEGAPPPLDSRAIGGFLYIGLFGTVLAYAVWFRAMQRLPAGRVALIGLLNPVAGTVIGIALADEMFGPNQAIGTALVLAGILGGQPAVRKALRRAVTPRTSRTTSPIGGAGPAT